MAGGKSPWGKGTSGASDGGAAQGGAGDGVPGDAGDSDGAPSGAGNGDAPKGPRNPWLPGGDDGRRSATIEDLFKQRRPGGPRRSGGGPGGPGFQLPRRPDGGSWFPLAVMAIVGVWLMLTSVHQVETKEQGIVSWLGGKYSRTLSPGINFTLPWPIQSVSVENVSEFNIETIPDGTEQKLMLTGDQNLVDLSYIVRWNIKDLKQYRYQLVDPQQTVREVAEAAMRASVAEETLNRVLSGAGRASIEASVLQRMQAVLDAYKSGIQVQGVQIRKTDPPKEVEDAFKEVSAAQQDAESYRNQAEATAQQVLARAEGDAAAFDKVYAQYKLAPEVTRRRMYYETMERVLRQTDKTVIEAPGVTPYLPLPEVKKRADAQPQIIVEGK
ncbi:MAG: protease modulator HflK [Sphingomonadales bacterium]|nr:protease modulator HflK [Sphingomonadales bacterium]MBD3773059.1 protease modulator HflK [Paracoccaceae bacterium]